MRPIVPGLLLLTAAAVSAATTFKFSCRNMGPEETFFAATSDSKVIAAARTQLKLPTANRQMIVGKLAKGSEGNIGWSWHFVEGWGFADLATEVCDAKPSYVEQNLDAWLKSPGNFCPWASYVSAEMPFPNGVLEEEPLLRRVPGAQSVSFRLARAADIAVELRRIDGALAAVLLRAPQPAGERVLPVDARGLSRGVYRLVLKADGTTLSTQSFVLE